MKVVSKIRDIFLLNNADLFFKNKEWQSVWLIINVYNMHALFVVKVSCFNFSFSKISLSKNVYKSYKSFQVLVSFYMKVINYISLYFLTADFRVNLSLKDKPK